MNWFLVLLVIVLVALLILYVDLRRGYRHLTRALDEFTKTIVKGVPDK